MVLGRRGQAVFLGIMIAMLAIIAIITFIEPLKDQVDIARGVNGLDCDAAGLSVGNQMACILTDWMLVGFVGVGLAVALSYLKLRNIRFGEG